LTHEIGDTVAVAAPGIPEIDQLSAGWLGKALDASGLGSRAVTGFSLERVGTGQAAVCGRITLRYDDPQPSFPKSVVAKFPADDSASRQAAQENKTYLREVNFYRYLQARLSVRAPRCYYADIKGDGPEFVLLLEDLAPAQQGDQIGGCSPALARAAVLELVGLHAPSWREPSFIGLDWLGEGNAPGRSRSIMQVYQKALPHFMERCTAGLSAEERKLVERIAEGAEFPSEYPLLKAYCLTHNDYRADNLLIDESQGAPSLHVVDWQTLGVGNPMKDVAYFLGGCLQPTQRAAIEKELLGEYHAALIAAGVADYAWDQCWADYRRASFHGIMTAVAGAYFVTRTERGDRLFAIMAQRHARQALDVGASEFLS
jgi:aminoglycoside/choline kinase family phosphotransferase